MIDEILRARQKFKEVEATNHAIDKLINNRENPIKPEDFDKTFDKLRPENIISFEPEEIVEQVIEEIVND